MTLNVSNSNILRRTLKVIAHTEIKIQSVYDFILLKCYMLHLWNKTKIKLKYFKCTKVQTYGYFAMSTQRIYSIYTQGLETVCIIHIQYMSASTW